MFIAANSPTVALRRLEWDSLHFGVPVAELSSPDLNDEVLRDALTAARAEGLHLIYWATHRDRTPSADLLVEFHGVAINHRVKFVASLSNVEPRPSGSGVFDSRQPLPDGRGSKRSLSYRIREFPRGPAPSVLLRLSIVAGGHSRFQVDPRIPADKFRELYEVWMNRSTLRELADVVLVATPSDTPDDFVGVITLSETAGAGQIGLLAVREDHRGQGVATLLMTAAHDWLRGRGATELSVVTQLENREACGLYTRWNCEAAEVRRWFHFWPQGADEVR